MMMPAPMSVPYADDDPERLQQNIHPKCRPAMPFSPSTIMSPRRTVMSARSSAQRGIQGRKIVASPR